MVAARGVAPRGGRGAGGQAGAVLTLYLTGDAAPPEVQFRALLTPEPPPRPAAPAPAARRPTAG